LAAAPAVAGLGAGAAAAGVVVPAAGLAAASELCLKMWSKKLASATVVLVCFGGRKEWGEREVRADLASFSLSFRFVLSSSARRRAGEDSDDPARAGK
jgi:hypothetical protein